MKSGTQVFSDNKKKETRTFPGAYKGLIADHLHVFLGMFAMRLTRGRELLQACIRASHVC